MITASRLALTLGLLLAAVPPLAAQPVTAPRHMAATANPAASQAANAVLNQGGSAVDAAIAAQMVLAVVEPQSSGLGGGSVMMVWDAGTKSLAFFDGLASAPAGMPPDYAHRPDGTPIPRAELDRSGRVVAVPGALPTMALVHARYGKLPWARLFRDAIAIADNGFPMPRYLHLVLTERKDLANKPAFAAYFGADGVPLPVGTILRNPALAATLRQVADRGPAALTTGPIAADIVAAVAQGPYPGTLTVADLAGFQPRERTPVCLTAFGHRICSAAPSAGGIPLLQQLAILDRLNLSATTPGSPAAAHLLLEASRLTRADRRSFIGDPDQVKVPTQGLLDPFYLDGRARLVRPDRAMDSVEPGNPPVPHAALPASDPVAWPATTHLSIVDDSGSVVSLTTTINLNFGADILVDGMVLNDALVNFATRPMVDGIRVANAAAPGKRPDSTMAPTIVFGADGTPVLVVGAGGAARIIDSVAQTIAGVLAWNMDVRTAIEQPRIGAQTGVEELERGTPAAGLADALRDLGHLPKIDVMNAGVQAIAIKPGELQGWGDPHRDGVAVGN